MPLGRLQAPANTSRVKVSLYTIKSLLVKRLTTRKERREIHSRLTAFKISEKHVCSHLSGSAHLQSYALLPSHTNSKADTAGVPCSACNY